MKQSLPVAFFGVLLTIAGAAAAAACVTTLQVMHGDDGMLALRDSISRGVEVGPQLIVGSPRLDGNPPSGPYPRIVGSQAFSRLDERLGNKRP